MATIRDEQLNSISLYVFIQVVNGMTFSSLNEALFAFWKCCRVLYSRTWRFYRYSSRFKCIFDQSWWSHAQQRKYIQHSQTHAHTHELNQFSWKRIFHINETRNAKKWTLFMGMYCMCRGKWRTHTISHTAIHLMFMYSR